MKQFQYTEHGTANTTGPHTLAEASECMPKPDADSLSVLDVGQRLRMLRGDWIRLPDLVEESAKAAQTDIAKAERLERISTAAMAAIISKHAPLDEGDPDYHCVDKMVAIGAVDYAKALIAELDRQS